MNSDKEKYEMLCIKNILIVNLKRYFTAATLPYNVFNEGIDILSRIFENEREKLQRFKGEVFNMKHLSRVDDFTLDFSKELMLEMHKLVDLNYNSYLQTQIDKLTREIREMKLVTELEKANNMLVDTISHLNFDKEVSEENKEPSYKTEENDADEESNVVEEYILGTNYVYTKPLKIVKELFTKKDTNAKSL
jgi:hypothetical protein